MVEQLKKLEIAITDYCNLDCRLCSQSTPIQKNKKTMSLADLARISQLIRPGEFDYIKISGGEPTLHPRFAEICRYLREWFPTGKLELATNGCLLEKYWDCLPIFESVSLNRYPGKNDAILDRVKARGLSNLMSDTKAENEGMLDVYARKNLGKTGVYAKCTYKDHFKIVQDRIYPCCVIFGQAIRDNIDVNAVSVVLDENWRQNLARIDLEPYCKTCFVDVDTNPADAPCASPSQVKVAGGKSAAGAAHHAFVAALRDKWREVPCRREDRTFSTDMLAWRDDDAKVKALFGDGFVLNWNRNFGKRSTEFNWFDLTKKSIPLERSPYLSIVAAARNDDHGGNLLHRMQLFVDGIFAQSAKFSVPVELILVEWNPPADRKPLAEVLSWPASHDCCAIRIIQVPPTTHQNYAYAAALPLYQMIAKNVGIRRARAEFVLATNVDVLLSDELFAFLSSGQLRRGALYRVDRYDVQNLPAEAIHEVRLEFCRANAFRINKCNGTINLLTGDYHRIYPDQGRLARERLHTNTSGDFQLMHRDHWFALNGYPEFDMYSFHLDSLMCYMAHFGGAREQFLDPPMCIYHIEHAAGWTPESDKQTGLWNRLEKSGIPRMTNDELHAWAERMTAERRPIIFNNDDWGHAAETFVECSPMQKTLCPQNEMPERRPGEEKYISIVVTSRNDDHGGNTLHRTRVFVKALAEQCRRFNLDAELLFVEWNPPADKPRLAEVLDFPDDLGPLSIRFIRVPPEVHSSIGNSDKFPLFQMIAKNVGIRRAAGKFVLATNVDILFNDEVMKFLASRQLAQDCVYRIDRHDVHSPRIPEDINVEGQLEYCRNHLVRVQGLNGTQPISEIGRDHFTYTAVDKLHTNACGDFTLMSREAWHRLRGYPELPLWSIYVDGLLLHMASADGLRQVILEEPLRIYHIEHETGWEVIPQTMQQRPSLDYNHDYLPLCRRMLGKKRPVTSNDSDWGYANMDFTEIRMEGRWKEPGEVLASGDPTEMFQQWIDTFAAASNRLYYRDQTAQSLKKLHDLVRDFRPTKIVELGTLSGMSLRTWLAAETDAQIVAIDLSFEALHASRRLIPLDLSRVRLIEQDIRKVDFASLWSAEDRVLLYIDAHDQANLPLMRHLLNDVIPRLPRDSIIGVDDLWYSADALEQDNILKAADDVTLFGVDPLQCFEGYFAPYWKGGFWIGFQEVIPLMEWINARKIDLMFEPRDKAVFFRPAAKAQQTGFDLQRFSQGIGQFYYNPVEQIQVLEKSDTSIRREAELLCKQGAQLYAERKIHAALKCFDAALKKTPNIRGALYAQAICYTAAGDFQSALIACDMVPDAFSHCRRKFLKQDIERRLNSRRREMLPATAQKQPPQADLAIFTMPKPFKGHIGTIQHNAIQSWMRLKPRPEIILLGDEEGTAETAHQYGLKHVPQIQRNEAGTPLLDSMFRNGASASAAGVLAYINTDILLLDDFTASVEQVRNAGHGRFLMVGQRWDLDVDRRLNFATEDWADQLRAEIRQNGTLHPPAGVDYFVFNRDLWPAIPPFALGRTVWDNWLVAEAIRLKAAVVDATECVTVVHQNHDYNHLAGGQEEAWKGVEAKRNLELAGGYGNIRSISYASHVLTSKGICSRTAILNDQGEAAFHEGDFDRAMQYFSQAAAIEPDNRVTLNNLGVLHWQTGRIHEAMQSFKAALHVSNDRDTVLNIIRCCKALDRTDEAAEIIRLYQKQWGDDARLRAELTAPSPNMSPNGAGGQGGISEHASAFAQMPMHKKRRPDMRMLGTEYGGWAVDLDLIPPGSTVISAGVGEDISFDLQLVELRNCTIVGVDPTPKACDYVRRLGPRNFHLVQKALHPHSGRRIRIYRNGNPDHVSESILPTHQSVLANDYYEAETISLPDLLQACPNVSVLKMDIEGAEYDVLNALETLQVPQLCVEFHHPCTHYTINDTMKCIKHLDRLGYVCAHTRSKAGPFHEVTFVHRDCIRAGADGQSDTHRMVDPAVAQPVATEKQG